MLISAKRNPNGEMRVDESPDIAIYARGRKLPKEEYELHALRYFERTHMRIRATVSPALPPEFPRMKND
jgi:hypothetical protein